VGASGSSICRWFVLNSWSDGLHHFLSCPESWPQDLARRVVIYLFFHVLDCEPVDGGGPCFDLDLSLKCIWGECVVHLGFDSGSGPHWWRG